MKSVKKLHCLFYLFKTNGVGSNLGAWEPYLPQYLFANNIIKKVTRRLRLNKHIEYTEKKTNVYNVDSVHNTINKYVNIFHFTQPIKIYTMLNLNDVLMRTPTSERCVWSDNANSFWVNGPNWLVLGQSTFCSLFILNEPKESFYS